MPRPFAPSRPARARRLVAAPLLAVALAAVAAACSASPRPAPPGEAAAPAEPPAEEATPTADADALRAGFEFRGLGQEPGWMVDVDPDRAVRWVGDYGTVRFTLGAPEREATEEGWVWRVGGDGHEVAVAVTEEACYDAMSGQPFTHTVEVTVDGETLGGCGGWLTP